MARMTKAMEKRGGEKAVREEKRGKRGEFAGRKGTRKGEKRKTARRAYEKK